MKKFHSLFHGSYENKFIRIIWSVSIAGFVAGMLWASTSILYITKTVQTIETKLHDMNRLIIIKTELDKALSAKRFFDKLKIKQPLPFTELLEANKNLAIPEQVREHSRTIGNGWTVISRELTFKNVGIMETIELARRIEQAGESSNNKLERPQWRLSEYTIQTLPKQAGYANIKLIFTAIRTQ